MPRLTARQTLLLDKTQEECAELIVAIAKIKTFGLDSKHDGKTNAQCFLQESGDVLEMLSQLIDEPGFGLSLVDLVNAKTAKREKLKKWFPQLLK